jgi:hypothetical protein
MLDFVSWDDDIPYIMEKYGKIKFMFRTANQPVYCCTTPDTIPPDEKIQGFVCAVFL